MSTISQDIYITNQSNTNNIENIGELINLNVTLSENLYDLKGGRILGTITDMNKSPIEGVFVKLLSKNSDPLRHVVSDVNGNYKLDALLDGQYNLLFSGPGYKTQEINNVVVTNSLEINMDVTLSKDPNSILTIVTGILTDYTGTKPIGGAILFLNKIDDNNSKTLTSITYTNQYGQFTFLNLDIGNYIITFKALGYISFDTNISVLNPGDIMSLNMYMANDPKSSHGTVSGMIFDSNKFPISNANVILYEIDLNNNLIPVAFTETNENGVYLFINVPKGNYKIKSNQSRFVTV